jgi:hypothetical protein
MTAWLRYAAVTALILVLLAWGVVLLLSGADPRAVWVAAAAAWLVQLAAFGVLLAGRGREIGFVVGWGGGMAMRFVALAGMAIWVSVSEAHQPESALLSLIGFMMVLTLIEPLFLRMAD